jgi:hypothetical protein
MHRWAQSIERSPAGPGEGFTLERKKHGHPLRGVSGRRMARDEALGMFLHNRKALRQFKVSVITDQATKAGRRPDHFQRLVLRRSARDLNCALAIVDDRGRGGVVDCGVDPRGECLVVNLMDSVAAAPTITFS